MTPKPSPPTACLHTLIRASAGSGKTFQLTARYLNLLRHGARPSSILATTFTRKAAGEILSRILHWLAQAQREGNSGIAALRRNLDQTTPPMPGPLEAVNAANVRRWLDMLITDLPRLRVGTLDSFFGRIAQAYPFELDLAAHLHMTDDGSHVVTELRMQAITDMLNDADRSDARRNLLLELLRQVHFDKAKQSVTASLDTLLQSLYDLYREAPAPAQWAQLQVPAAVSEKKVRRAREALDALDSLIPTNRSNSASNGKIAQAFTTFLEQYDDQQWEDLLKTTLAQRLLEEGDHGPVIFNRCELPAELTDPAEQLARHALHGFLTQLREQTRATFELLQRFDVHFRQAKQRRGILCFTDLSMMLAAHVRSSHGNWPMDLYERLDEQVGHLLLDEFQDTSLLQWRILEPMADEILAYADGSHSFFCVGDAKQSIYGWRGGLPELFDAVETRYQDHLRVTSLDHSWRSSAVVLDAVNRLFGQLDHNPMWLVRDECNSPGYHAAAAWCRDFHDHTLAEPLRADPPPGHVWVQVTPADDVDEPDDFTREDQSETQEDGDDAATTSADRRHLDFVAQAIANLHQRAPGRSIAVLVRNRKWIRDVVDRLRAHGVPASAEGASSLLDSPAVTAVLAAMTLADHPGDTIARFHVAHGPLGPMLSITPDTPSATIARMAASLRADLLRDGYAEVVAQWTHALASHCAPANLRRLTQLAEIARQYDNLGGAGQRPATFADFVRSAALPDAQASGVRVMTIHAAKGLEFDAVVLPQLHSAFEPRMQAAATMGDLSDGITDVQAVFRMPGKKLLALSPQLEALWQAEQQRKRREWFCTLYVAMTRARHGLYLFVPPRKLNKKGVGKLEDSLASLVREGLKDPGLDESDLSTPIPAGLLHSSGDANWFASLKEQKQAPAPATDALATVRRGLKRLGKAKPAKDFWRELERLAPSRQQEESKDAARILLPTGSAQARLRGTVMHAWCELVGFVDQPKDIPTDTALIAMARRLAPQVDLAEIEKWITVFRQSLAATTVHDVLTRQQASDLWRERKLQCVEDGRLISAVLDRVALWRDAHGRCQRALLIDFKTDREDDPQALIAHYQPQLQIYRRLLARATGLPPQQIETVLVSLQHAWVIPVPDTT